MNLLEAMIVAAYALIAVGILFGGTAAMTKIAIGVPFVRVGRATAAIGAEFIVLAIAGVLAIAAIFVGSDDA